jgi:class 3 adenylate cyclase
VPDLLEMGREAVRQNHWSEAATALAAASRDDKLSPDDLLLLAEALWWSGEPDDAVDVFERAFAGFEREERYSDAATVGARLAYLAMRRLSPSIAGGWISRIERLLDGQPESVGHAWLSVLYVAKALMFENDMEKAAALADGTIAVGRRFGIPGVQALGMSFKGVALVHSGDWRSGIKLMDEATAVATSEGGDLRAAGDVYCNTIAMCRNLGDYRRAGEWTDKADRWMLVHSVGGYSGICRVHRAELKRLRGSWSEAEHDARDACIELERFHIMDGVGFAQYEIGEVRRRMGDLASAEEAFLRAYEYGHDGQPGLSLLLFNKGDVEEAAKSIAAALRRPDAAPSSATPDLSRARLLPAQVEIALAAGDTETARQAVGELDELALLFEAPTWSATALTCRGALDLHEGQFEKAVEGLSRAWRLWREIGLPYESAQARVLLGQAKLAQGDEGAARLEFGAAASVFGQLGAAFDLRRLQEITGDTTEARRERVSKVFMFTDIVTSTDLIGLIGDAAWENLLHWHDRALRDAISKSGGEVVRHTGDGFFAAFDNARASIDCAVTIQRMLETHRREHGFAPWVRIGLHVADATREGGDYAGQGVHAAARVGALANQEEIVISSQLLEAAGVIPYQVTEARPVTLKGIAEPFTVHSVEWRLLPTKDGS